MILILGYNNSETEFLNEILDSLNIHYKYSLLEPQIIKADKFILPHPLNFNSTYRKLNMMNLFSILKMVEKPMLGINNGFRLMCNQLLDNSKCGLGFFPIELNLDSDYDISEKLETGKLGFKNPSKLLSSKFEGEKIKFKLDALPMVCEFSKAVFKYENYYNSLTYENNNYFGVEMDFELNPKISYEIIRKFAKL